MRLKAIVAAAMAALALSGVLASGAGASVVLDPTPEEMAAHPGMSHAATCDISSEESNQSQFTDEFMEKANAEGKCREWWFTEPPLTDSTTSSAVAAKSVHKTLKHAKRHHRKHRHR